MILPSSLYPSPAGKGTLCSTNKSRNGQCSNMWKESTLSTVNHEPTLKGCGGGGPPSNQHMAALCSLLPSLARTSRLLCFLSAKGSHPFCLPSSVAKGKSRPSCIPSLGISSLPALVSQNLGFENLILVLLGYWYLEAGPLGGN